MFYYIEEVQIVFALFFKKHLTSCIRFRRSALSCLKSTGDNSVHGAFCLHFRDECRLHRSSCSAIVLKHHMCRLLLSDLMSVLNCHIFNLILLKQLIIII